MRYVLLVHADEKTIGSLSADETQARMGRYFEFDSALKEAGIHRGGEGLQNVETATTVRVRDGETLLHDGPYAELREQFGGYWLIQVNDLDAAIAWAVRCPGSEEGAVEVRPVMELPS